MTKRNVGDKVWLSPFDNGDNIVPAQRVTLTGTPETHGFPDVYTGDVHPDDQGDTDDSITEFDESQIDAERGSW